MPQHETLARAPRRVVVTGASVACALGFEVDDFWRGLLEGAALPTDGARQLDIDLILGTGHGNVGLTNEGTRIFYAEGYRKMRPTTVVRAMFNRPGNISSIRYQL